jgi:programmed cell death protein 5
LKILVSRISIVKPEKARSIEDYLLNMAQRGQLASKVTEEQLIAMLSQIAEQETAAKPKIVVL